MAPDKSKVLKARGFRWASVAVRDYKRPGKAPFKDVTRQTLLGEGDGEEPLKFVTRYFEIEPGGYSTLERHRHPHAVIVIRGRGSVTLGGRAHHLAPHDCVYVAPGQPHQFQAAASQPLGFLCIVDRDRDRPEVLSAPRACSPRPPRRPASPTAAPRNGHRRSKRRPRR